MAYNYAREKRKFDAEWKRLALWYRKEGMNDEDIEVTHRFDLTQFNRDRAYESRLSSVGDGLRLEERRDDGVSRSDKHGLRPGLADRCAMKARGIMKLAHALPRTWGQPCGVRKSALWSYDSRASGDR